MTGHNGEPTTNWLTAARRAAGLSVLELAVRAGVAPRTIERLENEGRKPHPSTVKVLALALSMEETDLYQRQAA